jgi:hypothetical protein
MWSPCQFFVLQFMFLIVPVVMLVSISTLFYLNMKHASHDLKKKEVHILKKPNWLASAACGDNTSPFLCEVKIYPMWLSTVEKFFSRFYVSPHQIYIMELKC